MNCSEISCIGSCGAGSKSNRIEVSGRKVDVLSICPFNILLLICVMHTNDRYKRVLDKPNRKRLAG